MINRAQLLKNEKFWTETIQNKIYHDLASYIEKEKISQKELAKRLGVSKGRISQILNGTNLNFRIDTLVKICMAIEKIPNFKLEDIDSFIETDAKSNYISSVYNQEYNELGDLDSKVSFKPKEAGGKLIQLRVPIKEDEYMGYENRETSKVV